MKRSKIIATYPDGDGELHIDAVEMQNCTQFTFSYANKAGAKPAALLAAAAADISAWHSRVTKPDAAKQAESKPDSKPAKAKGKKDGEAK